MITQGADEWNLHSYNNICQESESLVQLSFDYTVIETSAFYWVAFITDLVL
jgi:hypothetical protein